MGSTATIIDVHKTVMNLAELLASSGSASEIIISDGDKLLARVVPIIPSVNDDLLKPRTPGLSRGLIDIPYDFDDPLPDEFWLGR